MRLVVQRVLRASVTVGDRQLGRIGPGVLVLVGIGKDDGEDDVRQLAEKLVELRIFEDEKGRMNLSLRQLREAAASEAEAPGILSVSQFTLYGDCRKGRRPGFDAAASPDRARELYASWKRCLIERGFPVEDGEFAAHMHVELVNDGPVTLLLDSSRAF